MSDPAEPPPPGVAQVTLGEVESAFESVLSAVLVVDDRGTIAFANTAAVVLFGYPAAQLLGSPVELLVPAAARQAHIRHREAFLQRPVPRPMSVRQHLSAVRADGSTLQVEVALSPLHTATGVFTTAMVHDVTARRAEEEVRRVLQLRERHLEVSQEIAGMGSWDRYHDTGVVHWSANLYRILGHAPGAVTPGTEALLAHVHPDDHALLRQHDDQVLAGGPPARIEVRLLRQATSSHPPGGPQRWVCLQSVTVEKDAAGRPVHSMGVVQDITRRKARDQDLLDRAARDARIAAVLQDGLMPLVPRRVGAVQVAVRYLPAGNGERIGGDWADVFPLPNGRIGLVIGDVAGHGVEASATMSRLRTLVRLLACNGTTPAAVIQQLNQAVHQLDLGDTVALATVVHAQLAPHTGTLTSASAGHLPLLLLPTQEGDGDVEAVATASDPPVGAVEDWPYAEDTVALRPGSVVLGFTDGLVERRAEDLATSLHHFMSALGSVPTGIRSDVEALADTVLVLPGDGSTDDVAVVVLQCPPAVVDLSDDAGSDRPAPPTDPPAPVKEPSWQGHTSAAKTATAGDELETFGDDRVQ